MAALSRRKEGHTMESVNNDNIVGRYQVHFYYTHIKQDLITHQVKRFIMCFDDVKDALKRARKLAEHNKGIHTATVIDTETGDIVYQKTEINNMGQGMWYYD